MYTYHLMEWLLFFYIYCFLGWVWESCLVSVTEKKWVNRGFLHGPFLPIYGFGAVIVLLATIPVKDDLALVFLFGMVAATALEYATGTVMERIFRVRYWDYSKAPFNVNGHICLIASIGWGFFSILMIRVLHRPVEMLLFMTPARIRGLLAAGLTVGIAADMTQSFKEAMDLKEVLGNLTENREEFQRLQKRLDAIVAVFDDETKEIRAKINEGREAIGDALEAKLLASEKWREEKVQEHQKKVMVKRATKRARVESALELQQSARHDALMAASIKIRESMEQMKHMTEEKKETDPAFDVEGFKRELEGFLKKLTGMEKRIDRRKKKKYVHSARILDRNPSATSKKYGDALEEIRKLEEK